MNEHEQDHDALHAAPTEKISVRSGEMAGRSDDPAAIPAVPTAAPAPKRATLPTRSRTAARPRVRRPT